MFTTIGFIVILQVNVNEKLEDLTAAAKKLKFWKK